MRSALIVVDMQVDFIDGSLGSKEAEAIVPRVLEKLQAAEGREVLFTMDTHGDNYFKTQEGRKLPVAHCVEGTSGWQLAPELAPFAAGRKPFRKEAFGSAELAEYLRRENKKRPYDEVELVGLCTDICVISNAMLIKAFLPEARVVVDSACCAGVSPQSHETALSAMRQCQIEVV